MEKRNIVGKRTWIKLYPIQCLHGSIRWQLTAAERGVWYDLLNLAAVMPYPGLISDSDKRPISHDFIAHELNITVELLEQTLKKCIDEGRIHKNENGLQIVNWAKYQSEYERQKPYREKTKASKETESSGEFFSTYEQNIGLITPVIAEELKQISEEYPFEWFKEAVKQATLFNKRNLKYVVAILKHWQAEGFKAKRKGETKAAPASLLEGLEEKNVTTEV